MNWSMSVFGAFVMVAYLFPDQVDKLFILLLFGGACIAPLLPFFLGAAGDNSSEPNEKWSFDFTSPAALLQFGFGAIMFVGYFGFFGGLFLAVLGFEPTTSNGTKLWLISGGVTLFGMAGAGLTEWIKTRF
ncbi:MAG: hypothetical protein HLUCCA05_07630 [Roseibaca calidilacus]|uniref:Uncharacterized protein n=2 Tax=Roseibaca calidilacus TaxID=1666912 RepID=A0A0P7WHN7_9RHOB|nr:MAG: hypothetical protein HLUCCA05_07630 [Roseibaca calidilacus]CUX81131.1 hypothetical protein Ga0058931_1570 [Roseibaca calidilacus]